MIGILIWARTARVSLPDSLPNGNGRAEESLQSCVAVFESLAKLCAAFRIICNKIIHLSSTTCTPIESASGTFGTGGRAATSDRRFTLVIYSQCRSGLLVPHRSLLGRERRLGQDVCLSLICESQVLIEVGGILDLDPNDGSSNDQ